MKQHSDLILTSDITSTFPGPLDNKMIVNSVADLTDAASWKIYNSRLQMQMSLWYPQMLVIVKSEDATAGVYQFSGTEEYELEDIGKWRKLAFADDIVAPPSADTIKGDWEPDVDGSGITNYPGANNAYRVTGNAAQALGIEIGDIVFINETNTGTTAVLKAANAVLNTDAIQEGAINKYYPPSDREKLDTIEVGAQKNVDPDWDSMKNKPFIPSDIVDLTDVAGRIPVDVSQLSDAGGILTSELPNLSSVVGGTITEALNTLKTANTTVKGEWEPILLGEEPIQNLFHQIVPDPIAGSGNPSVSIQDDGKSLLGISNSPGVDWTNVLYFSPAQVSLKFKTTLNSSMGPNTAVSVGHFNSDENLVSEMVAGLNMYSDNKIAVMFVEYDEPNGSVIQTQATAKADVGVDSLDEIYVFILGDDLIVHVNDIEVARATFSNGAPTTTASVTQSKMLCASIGLGDTLEMLEIIPVAMNYPAQFANNAFTIVGNALSPIADDGDIVIGNKAGDGIAKVIGKSGGGGSGSGGNTIKGTWTPAVTSTPALAKMQRADAVFMPMHDDLIDEVVFTDNSISTSENGEGGMAIASTPFDISSSTEDRFVVYMKYEGPETPYFVYYGVYSGLATLLNDMPIIFSPSVYYESGLGLVKSTEDDPEILYADWNPHTDSVAHVMDFDKEAVEVWTSRNGGAKVIEQSFADMEQLVYVNFEATVTIDKDLVTRAALNTYFAVYDGEDYRPVNSGKMSAAKTFDVSPSAVDVFESTQVVDLTPPENAANNAFILDVANPVYIPEIGKELVNGDIVFFDGDSVPFRYIPKEFAEDEVTLKPWTPATYVEQGIDLITPVDPTDNGLTATLTGSTVSVTGNAEQLVNGLVSDAGVLSTTQANNLYFKMGARVGFSAISTVYVGFINGAGLSTIDNFVLSNVTISPDATTMFVNTIGNMITSDVTVYDPELEIPTSSASSEFCVSYMPIGGANGFGYVTLYVDGVQVARHDFTQAVAVDSAVVTPYATFPTADPFNSAWVECLSNPVYPIAGLPPLIIGAGSTKLDETAYPTNATSNIFEITGTPSPLQWDALGGTVVNGDLVAFGSKGLPRTLGEDVDLTGYATKAWVENKGYISNEQIDTDETLSSDRDDLIPSQKAVKAYVGSDDWLVQSGYIQPITPVTKTHKILVNSSSVTLDDPDFLINAIFFCITETTFGRSPSTTSDFGRLGIDGDTGYTSSFTVPAGSLVRIIPTTGMYWVKVERPASAPIPVDPFYKLPTTFETLKYVSTPEAWTGSSYHKNRISPVMLPNGVLFPRASGSWMFSTDSLNMVATSINISVPTTLSQPSYYISDDYLWYFIPSDYDSAKILQIDIYTLSVVSTIDLGVSINVDNAIDPYVEYPYFPCVVDYNHAVYRWSGSSLITITYLPFGHECWLPLLGGNVNNFATLLDNGKVYEWDSVLEDLVEVADAGIAIYTNGCAKYIDRTGRLYFAYDSNDDFYITSFAWDKDTRTLSDRTDHYIGLGRSSYNSRPTIVDSGSLIVINIGYAKQTQYAPSFVSTDGISFSELTNKRAEKAAERNMYTCAGDFLYPYRYGEGNVNLGVYKLIRRI